MNNTCHIQTIEEDWSEVKKRLDGTVFREKPVKKIINLATIIIVFLVCVVLLGYLTSPVVGLGFMSGVLFVLPKFMRDTMQHQKGKRT